MEDIPNLIKHWPCAVKTHFPGQQTLFSPHYIYKYIYIYVFRHRSHEPSKKLNKLNKPLELGAQKRFSVSLPGAGGHRDAVASTDFCCLGTDLGIAGGSSLVNQWDTWDFTIYPFGNSLYHLFMVIWGMNYYYCFTHITKHGDLRLKWVCSKGI